MPMISDMVELPKDANGETIQPGARVMHDGKVWLVRTLMLTDEGEWLLDCQPEDGEPPAGRTVRPEGCVVVHRRTVEDVLSEFSCVLMGKREFDGDVTEAIAEYADEIRRMLDGR